MLHNLILKTKIIFKKTNPCIILFIKLKLKLNIHISNIIKLLQIHNQIFINKNPSSFISILKLITILLFLDFIFHNKINVLVIKLDNMYNFDLKANP